MQDCKTLFITDIREEENDRSGRKVTALWCEGQLLPVRSLTTPTVNDDDDDGGETLGKKDCETWFFTLPNKQEGESNRSGRRVTAVW